MISLRAHRRCVQISMLHRFFSTKPAVPVNVHRTVTLGLYRSLLSAATHFARSAFGSHRMLDKTDHTRTSPSSSSPASSAAASASSTFSLPLLTSTGTYDGRWPQSVWLSLWRAGRGGKLSPASIAASAVALEEKHAQSGGGGGGGEGGARAMVWTPERARLLVRSVSQSQRTRERAGKSESNSFVVGFRSQAFRARMKEQDSVVPLFLLFFRAFAVRSVVHLALLHIRPHTHARARVLEAVALFE